MNLIFNLGRVFRVDNHQLELTIKLNWICMRFILLRCTGRVERHAGKLNWILHSIFMFSFWAQSMICYLMLCCFWCESINSPSSLSVFTFNIMQASDNFQSNSNFTLNGIRCDEWNLKLLHFRFAFEFAYLNSAFYYENSKKNEHAGKSF